MPSGICQYLNYFGSDFEVFSPVGETCCTNGVKFGKESTCQVKSTPHAKLYPVGSEVECGTQKNCTCMQFRNINAHKDVTVAPFLGRRPNFGSRPNNMGVKFPSVRPSVHKKFLRF